MTKIRSNKVQSNSCVPLRPGMNNPCVIKNSQDGKGGKINTRSYLTNCDNINSIDNVTTYVYDIITSPLSLLGNHLSYVECGYVE